MTQNKPMKSTKIEHPTKLTPQKMQSSANSNRGHDQKSSSSFKRSIPQLVKSSSTVSATSKSLPQKRHQDDSNGNSATSSVSTSSSNSSLNNNSIKPSGSDVEFLTSQLNAIYSRGLIEWIGTATFFLKNLRIFIVQEWITNGMVPT